MNKRERLAMKRQADYAHPITLFDVVVCVIAALGIWAMIMQALAWAVGAR